jgi:hypothetical protein
MFCAEFYTGEELKICSGNVDLDSLKRDFDSTRIGDAIFNEEMPLRSTLRGRVCEEDLNLCGLEVDAEFERKGREYVIEELVHIQSYYTRPESCLFMDAVADQYKEQLYFHMYMSSIVEDEEGFNDMW